MQIAAIILGIAALGGLGLAGMRFSGMPRPPTWMAVGHGVVAVIGFATLIVAAMGATIPLLTQISMGVLALAALGGLGLFLGFHLQQRALPIPLVLVHGLVAVTGYVMLLVSLYA